MDGVLVDLGAAPGSAAVAGVGQLVVAQDPAPPPGRGEEFGKASPVALVVVLMLAVATILLIRSMTIRIRRLPTSFDEQPAPGPDPDGPPR